MNPLIPRKNPLLQDEPPPPVDAHGNPPAEQRADFVVKRLERFIREGRTGSEGFSLRQWQDMARTEIANALIAAENSTQDDDVVTKRLLFSIASALVTIGFWGALMAFDKASYLVTAIICGIAGFWLFAIVGEWRIRKAVKAHTARKRAKGLRRVENLTRRIRQMERELKIEEKQLEEQLKKEFEKAVKKKFDGEIDF